MERRRGGGVDVAPPLVVGDPRDAVRLPRGDQLERERRAHELRHRRRVRRACRRRGRARRGGDAEHRQNEDENRRKLANHGRLLICRAYCTASAQSRRSLLPPTRRRSNIAAMRTLLVVAGVLGIALAPAPPRETAGPAEYPIKAVALT